MIINIVQMTQNFTVIFDCYSNSRNHILPITVTGDPERFISKPLNLGYIITHGSTRSPIDLYEYTADRIFETTCSLPPVRDRYDHIISITYRCCDAFDDFQWYRFSHTYDIRRRYDNGNGYVIRPRRTQYDSRTSTLMITEQPPLSIDWNDVVVDFCPASVSASDIEHIASVPIRVVDEMCFGMCREWSSLVDINGLANWDTSGVTSVREAFCGCERLRDASGIERWTLTGVKDVDTMLRNCPQLEDEERKYIIAVVSGHGDDVNGSDKDEDEYGSDEAALPNVDESEMSEGDYSDLDESSDGDDYATWVSTIRELSDVNDEDVGSE